MYQNLRSVHGHEPYVVHGLYRVLEQVAVFSLSLVKRFTIAGKLGFSFLIWLIALIVNGIMGILSAAMVLVYH